MQAGKTYDVAPFALNPLATAGSGLPVSYASNTPAICTVAGSTITIVAAGTCTIAANQAGDATYNPAPQVTQNIVPLAEMRALGYTSAFPARGRTPRPALTLAIANCAGR